MSTIPTLVPITSGYACITALNTNFEEVETFLGDVFNKDDDSGLQTVQVDIDMDGNTITGLAAPVDPTDAVRYQDLLDAAEEGLVVETEASLVAHGQCRLAYVTASQIKLSRLKGPGGLIIDGTLEQIPSAGVTANYNNAYINGTAAQTLAGNTTYYVYAFMNSGTMTLDFSTTGPTLDTSTGVDTKTGATTRTLVGLIRTASGGTFVDSAAQRYTRTYFNDPGVVGLNSENTNDNMPGSGVWDVLDDVVKAEFVNWANETLFFSGKASFGFSGGDGDASFRIYLNSVSYGESFHHAFNGTTLTQNLSSSVVMSAGYNYVTMGVNLSVAMDVANRMMTYQTSGSGL